MPIGAIESLEIFEVYDHGVPNQERIAISVKDYCDLSEICVLLASRNHDGTTVPIRDHLLWLGHGYACPGDWIIVYTASGVTTVSEFGEPLPSGYHPRVFAIHWGKDHTVFQNRAVVPMLMQISAVAVPTPPAPQFQGSFKPSTPRMY